MKVMTFLIIGLVGLFILVLLVGFCLPSVNAHSKNTEFKARVHDVFNTVTNNDEWQYRKSLDNLTLINVYGEIEEWEETSKGNVIKFKTLEKVPYSIYSFKMEGSQFTGTWTGEFEAIGEETTRFKATEYIVYKNVLARIIGYLFLDLNSLMNTYQEELREKVEHK